jgi:hypothetical protein
MRNRFLIQTLSIMVFMFVVLPMGVYAVEGISSVSDKAENRWSIFGGYGITHSGLGKTRVQVQSVDFIPRYEHVLTETMGSSWYQGRHSLMLETPLTLVVDPDVAPMVGLNFIAECRYPRSWIRIKWELPGRNRYPIQDGQKLST